MAVRSLHAEMDAAWRPPDEPLRSAARSLDNALRLALKGFRMKSSAPGCMPRPRTSHLLVSSRRGTGSVTVECLGPHPAADQPRSASSSSRAS